jgi:hypothetical protein
MMNPFKTLFAISCLTLTLTSCQLNEEDIKSWDQSPSGPSKLAGYLADAQRPAVNRKLALSMLFDQKEYTLLLNVIKEANPVEREALFAYVQEKISDLIKPTTAPAKRDESVAFAFYLLCIDGAKTFFAPKEELMKDLIDWSLEHVKSNEKPILDEKIAMQPDELLVVLATFSNQALDAIEVQLNQHSNQVSYVVALSQILFKLKSAQADLIMAKSLMSTARAIYPDLTRELIDVMVENSNPTLIKFLVETIRDESPNAEIKKIKEYAFIKAVPSLHESEYPLLIRILESDKAERDHIFEALRKIWDLGKIDALAPALDAFNPNFKKPVSGQEMKTEVESFCKQFVSTGKSISASKLQEQLIKILHDHLEPKNWVARLYAVNCIHKLFPDDFHKLMKADGGKIAKSFEKDSTAISGWESARQVKMSEIYRRLLDLN